MISKVITFTAALVVATGISISAEAGTLTGPKLGAVKSTQLGHAGDLVQKANFKKHKKIKRHRGSGRKHRHFSRHNRFDRFDKFYRRHDFGKRRLGTRYHQNSRAFIYQRPHKSVSRLQPWTPAWHRYCASKFKSFDPKTGTYLALSGGRKFCN
ncbi:BA14K family protein [uncultured Roseibium sp.]|uniref:BA14K family protein n=1 Tax=uncultured Roseibium sp. TaxID=1936171 RepID=UPI002610DA49|nr:BA14K family protein [uncultured Roseibium sp.]